MTALKKKPSPLQREASEVHPHTDEAWRKQPCTGSIRCVQRRQCAVEKLSFFQNRSLPVNRHHHEHRREQPEMACCSNAGEPCQQIRRVKRVSYPCVWPMADEVHWKIRGEYGGERLFSIGINGPPKQDQGR